MNKKKIKLFIYTAIVIVFSLIAVVYIITRSNGEQNVPYTTPSYTPTQATKERIYRSKNLKFSVIIPYYDNTIQEGQTYVDIKINGMLIEAVRNGTNFESLKEYVKDFDEKKRVQVTEEKDETINAYATISRLETNMTTGVKQKIYYIFADSWIYSLSTSSESLFPVLDQIAQSFRYTP